MRINRTRKKRAKHRYKYISMFLSVPFFIGGCASQPKSVKVRENYSKEQIARECIKLKEKIDEFERKCSAKEDNFYCRVRDLEQDVYDSECTDSRGSKK